MFRRIERLRILKFDIRRQRGTGRFNCYSKFNLRYIQLGSRTAFECEFSCQGCRSKRRFEWSFSESVAKNVDSMPTPEELAREKIDALLASCDWIIQDRSTINLSAGRGVAIREALLQGGDEADYPLFVDGKAIGTVEA